MDCKENCLHCDDKCNTKSNTNQHGNCELKDEEIIKALECCADVMVCNDCVLYKRCVKDPQAYLKIALDLINRQKAEILELRADYNYLFETMPHMKTEAIKEFWRRLKNYAIYMGYVHITVFGDNLVKEMESEK